MKIIRSILFAAALGCCAVAAVPLILAAPAIAQEVADPGISIGGVFETLRPYVVETVSVLVGAFVLWVSATVKSKFGIDIEARHREALQSALTNGAGLAIGKAGTLAAAVRLDAGSSAVNAGVRLVLASVPDAIDFFGVSPEKIGDMLRAKIGVVAATNTPLSA